MDLNTDTSASLSCHVKYLSTVRSSPNTQKIYCSWKFLCFYWVM